MSLIHEVKDIFSIRNGVTSLHKSWETVEIKDVVKIQNGYAFKSANFNNEGQGFPLLRIRDILNGTTKTYFDGDYPEEYVVEKEDLLIGMDGDFNSDLWKGEKILLNQRVCRLFPNEKYLLKKFLAYGIGGYLEKINENTSSTTVKHLSSKSIGQIPFPLPPLQEQKRIVAKLDTLLASLENTKARLEKIPILIKNFKQAILTQAVTGKLTEQWREGKELEDMNQFVKDLSIQRKYKYEEAVLYAKKTKSKKPKKDFDFEFKNHPDKKDWCVAKLENLIYMSARIGWKGLKADEYTSEGPLFLSVHGLNYGENVNFDVAYHITEERYTESPEIMLEENDILLCKDGAGIGKLGVVKGLKEKATVNSSLLVIRGREALNYKFLYYFFAGPALQNIVKERITGTAIPHLFQKDIKEFYVEIPPLKEQTEIVRRVESLFAKADAIEAQYTKLKQKIDTLPQAILAKAFRGELVEQDPLDEPASILLEKIQSLRQAQCSAKSKKKVVRKKKSVNP